MGPEDNPAWEDGSPEDYWRGVSDFQEEQMKDKFSHLKDHPTYIGIKAEILADSISAAGHRLTTFKLRLPRVVLAELNTHRAFSRNAASSRAVPSAKMMERVMADPYTPIEWGANVKGMQSGDVLPQGVQSSLQGCWTEGRIDAVGTSQVLNQYGLHKQWANRPMEPYSWTEDVVSATSWNGFFVQRFSGAMPEFEILARKMLCALLESCPMGLEQGEWHIPFMDADTNYYDDFTKLKIATARCARASYVNFEGKNDLADDFRVHDDCAANFHPSPFEHIATPDDGPRTGNFLGWRQYRHFVFGEREKEINAMTLQEIADQFGVYPEE